MTSLAIHLWPRWLRIALVGIATAAIIGGGLFCYRYFAKPVVLSIAVGSTDGEANSLVSAIAARLAASGSHVRMKVIDSGTALKASEMLTTGKTQLAIVRGDTGNLSDARSVLLLSHGVVLILAPSGGPDSLGDLRNATIGVLGGEINRSVVEALKQVYQFDRAKVRFQDLAIARSEGAAPLGQDQAILAVVPLTERYLAKIRQYFQKAEKGNAAKLLEIGSAGAVANVAQYYESYDIPKGTLRGPARPFRRSDVAARFILSCRPQICRRERCDGPDAIADWRPAGFVDGISGVDPGGRTQHGCRCLDSYSSGGCHVLQREPAELLRQVR